MCYFCGLILDLFAPIPKSAPLASNFGTCSHMLSLIFDIIDYYPIDFDMDIINKRYLYECIPYLPVINMKRLKSSITLCELNKEETTRNSNN